MIMKNTHFGIGILVLPIFSKGGTKVPIPVWMDRIMQIKITHIGTNVLAMQGHKETGLKSRFRYGWIK